MHLVRCWALNMTASQACVYGVLSRNILLIPCRRPDTGWGGDKLLNRREPSSLGQYLPHPDFLFFQEMWHRACSWQLTPVSYFPLVHSCHRYFFNTCPCLLGWVWGPLPPSPSLRQQFVSLVSSFYPSVCQNLPERTPSHLVNAT